MSERLRVGGLTVPHSEAELFVRHYVLDDEKLYAFPYYDCLQTAADPAQLVEADLLAPVLLNVPVSIRAFRDLQRLLPRLRASLDELPIDQDLADAEDALLRKVGSCFAVLDDPDVELQGVRGTTLAKVLHRKRPRLLPLFDGRVRRVYELPWDGVPRVPFTGPWVAYMTALAGAMRHDLSSARGRWQHLSELGQGKLTQLRALDIVAWTLGDAGRVPQRP